MKHKYTKDMNIVTDELKIISSEGKPLLLLQLKGDFKESILDLC